MTAFNEIKYIQEIENLKYLWKYDDAKNKIRSYLIKYTDDYRLYEELADIYLYEWKINKAETAINFAQKLNSESATGTYLLWYIYISKWDFLKWINFLEKSNTLFPNNPEILRNLWWWYYMIWSTEKWITILKRALNISPEDKLIMEDLWVALIWNWNIELWEFYLKKAWKENRIHELKLLI